MEKYRDNTVIVIDTGNYKSSYSEAVPFKARVVDLYDHEVLVKSLTTNKEYELYHDQVLELLDIKEIKVMLDLKKYGDWLSPPKN